MKIEFLGKRDFLTKANKTPRCHNTQKAWNPPRPRVRLKRDLNTTAFPRSSSLHTVGSVILLVGGFSRWHIPLRRRDMLRQKLALVFRENPFSLNELMGYVEFTIHDFSRDGL